MNEDSKKTQHLSSLGNPINPSKDASPAMGDTYGLTGITVSNAPESPLSADDLLKQEQNQDDPIGLVSIFSDEALEKEAISPNAFADPDELILAQLDGSSDETINEATPTDVLGELSISGDTPDPESDDDMLLNSHQVGLRLDEDYDNPKPLNAAADVAAAERARRGG